MSNVFWRCILEGAPEMQHKNQKKRQAKRKKHVRHVNIFMVIPHNLRNALGSSEIFKMDCICIRQGVEGRGECARRVGVGRKRILHAAYEIDMQMLYEARGFFSPRADLKFWLSLFFSLSLPLCHWLRWWCTYCLLVNMIKIQISHYGMYVCVCVCRVEM